MSIYTYIYVDIFIQKIQVRITIYGIRYPSLLRINLLVPFSLSL